MAVPMGAYQYPSKPLYTYHSIRAGGGLRNAGTPLGDRGFHSPTLLWGGDPSQGSLAARRRA